MILQNALLLVECKQKKKKKSPKATKSACFFKWTTSYFCIQIPGGIVHPYTRTWCSLIPKLTDRWAGTQEVPGNVDVFQCEFRLVSGSGYHGCDRILTHGLGSRLLFTSYLFQSLNACVQINPVLKTLKKKYIYIYIFHSLFCSTSISLCDAFRASFISSIPGP